MKKPGKAGHLASVAWVKKRSAVPTKAFREALMPRYRRLKIEGGTFFFTLALADRGYPPR
jgi:hypothetical protein